MASGLSVFLPLTFSEKDGPYFLNKTIKELAKQNLKMVILTNPGERMMNPEFGVGISRFIFENKESGFESDIIGKINSQVSKHIPYVNLISVDVRDSTEFGDQILVTIEYSIPTEQKKQILNLMLNNT